jgi:hypothetical protein
MARAEEARAGYGTAGDHWGVAASSLVRAQGAVHAGEISTVATMTAEILRHSEVIGYTSLWFPRCCSRPGLLSCETNLVPRRTPTGAPSSSRGESALWTTSASPWSDSARTRSRAGTLQAEELCRRALAMAEAASTSRLAAHARVELAPFTRRPATRTPPRRCMGERCRVVANAPAAPSSRVALRRARRQPRGAALWALARLAAARGDDDAADNLQVRAAAMAERDRASPDALRGAAVVT